MEKGKLQSLFVPSMYILAILIFCFTLYLGQKLFNKESFNEEMIYVDNEIFVDNLYVPVMNESTTLLRPILKDDISIKYGFYNILDTEDKQENSIIYYEGTYMQSTGIGYSHENKFDVISILDGSVIEISDNPILGTTIKIQHNNNMISVYQSVGEVSVNVGDNVMRGQVIASSGVSKLYSTGTNLHFELIYQGSNVNPEEYYNKSVDEF